MADNIIPKILPLPASGTIDNTYIFITEDSGGTHYQSNIDDIPFKSELILADSGNFNGFYAPNTQVPLFSVTNKYTFNISSATTYVGDVYTNNGFYFQISSIVDSTHIICTGNGDPTVFGTLVFSSGVGSGNLTFSGFSSDKPRYIVTKVVLYLSASDGTIAVGPTISLGNNYPSYDNSLPSTVMTGLNVDDVAVFPVSSQGTTVVDQAHPLQVVVINSATSGTASYMIYAFAVFGYRIN